MICFRKKLCALPGFKLIFELLFVILPIAFLIRTFGFGLYQVPTGSMETTLLVGERFFADKLSYYFKQPAYGDIIAFNDPLYPYSSNFLVNLWQRYGSWKVSNWTKRVIGKPLDHIEGKIEEGLPVVYRNGQKLNEPYVNQYPLIEVRLPGLSDARGFKSFDPSLPLDAQKFYDINAHALSLSPFGEPIILYPGTPLPNDKDVFDIYLGDNEYWVMGDNRLASHDSRLWKHKPLDGKLIHGKIVYRIWSMDSDAAHWYSFWFIDLIKNPIAFWKKIRWNRCFQWVH